MKKGCSNRKIGIKTCRHLKRRSVVDNNEIRCRALILDRGRTGLVVVYRETGL